VLTLTHLPFTRFSTGDDIPAQNLHGKNNGVGENVPAPQPQQHQQQQQQQQQYQYQQCGGGRGVEEGEKKDKDDHGGAPRSGQCDAASGRHVGAVGDGT